MSAARTPDAFAGRYAPDQSRGWRLVRTSVFLLAGAAMLVWLFVDQRRAAADQELSRTGTSVQGTVYSLDTRKGGNLLTLTYGFTVGGTPYTIPDRRVEDFQGLKPRGPLTVWYDPSDPHRCVTANELRHPRYGWTPYFFAAIVVMLMALAALQAYQVLQPAREPLADE